VQVTNKNVLVLSAERVLTIRRNVAILYPVQQTDHAPTFLSKLAKSGCRVYPLKMLVNSSLIGVAGSLLPCDMGVDDP